MDLLYSRYASPFEFMRLYINQGRFGEFVAEITGLDFKRKQEEAKKENDDRLWSIYIRSLSEKSFEEWKEDLKVSMAGGSGNNALGTGSLSRDDIKATIQKSQAILNSFVPD